MFDQRTQIETFLKGLFLFFGIGEDDLKRISNWFEMVRIEKEAQIVTPGARPDAFYILLWGEVDATWQFGNDREETERLVTGDFFGEEAILSGGRRSRVIVAKKPSKLMRLDVERFHRLRQEYPKFQENLMRTVESRRLARRLKFSWLSEDEVIYQVARKHVAMLLVSLIGPFLLGVISMGIMFSVSSQQVEASTWITGAAISFVIYGIAWLWGIWNVIDWSNDYYIITNQRVVWVERVIWLYDSREEAPLTTIRAVDVRTSLLGRLLKYGDVIVNTYTGKIVLRNVGEPLQMAAVVEEYWHRAQRRSEEEEAMALEEAIHRRLEHVDDYEMISPEEDFVLKVESPRVKVPNIWRNYFSNFFKMRFEEGNVITYRKFWVVLFRKTFKPTVVIFAFGLFMIYYMVGFFRDPEAFDAIWQVILGGTFLMMFVMFPWWLYHYVDWRNDIYQVTNQYIFDIERKPLGTELKKSAPLESILSLEHERVGFLGYLFNFGNVTINVGDAKFVFLGVYDPARAQQDIFNRMYTLRQKKEMAEAARQRERIAEAIKMYHRTSENYRLQEDSNEDLL